MMVTHVALEAVMWLLRKHDLNKTALENREQIV